MARTVTARRIVTTAAAWIVRLPHLLSDPVDGADELQDRARGLLDAAEIPVLPLDHGELRDVQERSDYLHLALNSIILAGGSTLVGLLFAVPAAWAMAFAPGKRTKDLLLWMLSTKMMPPVGALVPIYLIFRDAGLLDTRGGLIVVLFLLNLPIIVWMLFTYFKEIPGEILEAARMDGATLWREIVYVLTPMAVPGIASTLLLNFILAWNEAFWTLNLTTLGGGAADRLHRLLLEPGGPVLGQAVGGLDDRHRADPDPRLVLASASWCAGLTFGAVK